MDNQTVEYRFLSREDMNLPEYKQMINTFFGYNTAWKSRIQRVESYMQLGDFKLIVAYLNGKMVGQASTYKVDAVINNEEVPFYWSCDTFVLPQVRGLGIGKQLQLRLHNEVPNFSSAWYSPINGIIKRNCGAKDLMDITFTYYPVSNFGGIMFQLISSKVFNKKIILKPIFRNIYSKINNLFRRDICKEYNINEVLNISDELANFMVSSLSQYRFYVKRNLQFLKWAYGRKVGKYKMFVFKKRDRIEAMVSYSSPKLCHHVVADFHGVTILDMVISPNSLITQKDLLFFVIKQNRENNLDGITALQSIPYLFKFTYPYPSVPLLSTYGKKIDKGYISMIDHDMDQL